MQRQAFLLPILSFTIPHNNTLRQIISILISLCLWVIILWQLMLSHWWAALGYYSLYMLWPNFVDLLQLNWFFCILLCLRKLKLCYQTLLVWELGCVFIFMLYCQFVLFSLISPIPTYLPHSKPTPPHPHGVLYGDLIQLTEFILFLYCCIFCNDMMIFF